MNKLNNLLVGRRRTSYKYLV